ncbi:hypothetical protein ACQEWB_18000 [Streptomyces sp. CA-249302]|uniref:hypothetical protein n=1 Tax=Streptomyces sp. CA-249302 TaxID=3240058 RepID=UPI003D9282F5
MSDIGNKWIWPWGEIGRLTRRMRVNETGRFSDGRNWADFLVEWATGETLMWGNRELSIRKSNDYRTLSKYSTLEVGSWDRPVEMRPWKTLEDYIAELKRPQPPKPAPPELRYVNYAMGGCIVTMDWTFPPKFGALSYLRGQVEDYILQRREMGTQFGGPTLHVVWIGLNDFVTVLRPDYDPAKTQNLPATDDYAAWRTWSQNNPGQLTGGVGVFPAVAEIQSLVELINSSFTDGEGRGDHHFMVVDLPSVYNAIRYMEGLAEPNMIEEARKIEPVTRRYNAMLASLVQHWPDGPNAPLPNNVQLVQMSRWMNSISANLPTWHLEREPQDRGVPVHYEISMPPGAKDPVPSNMRRRITTSDLGHPTEAVYHLIARYFVSEMLKRHTLGRLDAATWTKNKPFPDLPDEPQG